MGKVYLVGAGPGDPGLITIRGAECLAQAEVVLYDGLANPTLLAWANSAELICVGKHGSGPLWSQAEINDRLVELARQGRQVVRLKGGDPAVFARTAEELEALSNAGIAFEVVPGITAALAAASYVGIPITHRDHASAVAFVTGQQQADAAQDLDWSALAGFPGTLVFYMGVTTAGLWSQKLIAAGKDPQTPAAIIRRCTWRDQKVIRCSLDEVTDLLTPASKLRPPVIVIIGPVARLGEQFNWFDSLPLRGQGVWVARPGEPNSPMAQQLRELGAHVVEMPVTRIAPPEDWGPLDRALEQLHAGQYMGVAFTSRNAVAAVLDRLLELGSDCRALAGARLACVGDATTEYLLSRGLRADLVPTGQFNASELVAAIVKRGEASGQRWLLPQADQAAETLSSGLESAGALVERVTAYRSMPLSKLPPELESALERHELQWVTVTSPLIGQTLYRLLKPQQRAQLRPLSLSPAISALLRTLDWPPAAQAATASSQALVQALLEAVPAVVLESGHESGHEAE